MVQWAFDLLMFNGNQELHQIFFPMHPVLFAVSSACSLGRENFDHLYNIDSAGSPAGRLSLMFGDTSEKAFRIMGP